MRKVVFVALSVVLMFGGVLYSGRSSPAQADSPMISAVWEYGWCACGINRGSESGSIAWD